MIELLKDIVADVTFRPEEGPFRAALVAKVLVHADEEQAELFSASNCDIQVTVTPQTLSEGVIRFLVISDMGKQSLETAFAGMNERERGDFREQLSRYAAEQRPAVSVGGAKVIVRKASVAGMLTQQQAADMLSCSREALKSRIPCTDYSYDEIDGKKVLREFYWSQTLIERLQQIKANGPKPEDVKYVATECCFGDNAWAEDLLASLRPKPAVKSGTPSKSRHHRPHSRGGAHSGQPRKPQS